MAHGNSPNTPSLRMVLVGRTGTGKSSSGNTILERNVFDSSAELRSPTVECLLESAVINGTKLEVLDTPGLFDTKRSHEEVGVVIVKAFINMNPGPDIFLYVIKLGSRFTKEENGSYTRFKMLFGKRVTNHLIILFTGLDVIEDKGQTISEVLSNAPPDLQLVLKDCQGRYVVFNNNRKAIKGSVNLDVDQLLETALVLKKKNGGQPFQPENFCKIGETIEENVGKKLREIEDQEAKFLRYTQKVEADLRDKNEELDLSKAEHDKHMADLKTKLREEHHRMMEDFQLKKEQEEEQMQAREKTQAMDMRLEEEQQEQNKINRRHQEERESQEQKKAETEQLKQEQDILIQTMQEQNLQQQQAEAETQQRQQQDLEQPRKLEEMKIQTLQQQTQQQQEEEKKQERQQQDEADRQAELQQEERQIQPTQQEMMPLAQMKGGPLS